MSSVIKNHHMPVPWHELVEEQKDKLSVDSSLEVKSSLIGRVGAIMLSCGTGAWRVRESMNVLARVLHIRCSADVGLVSMEYTCIDEQGHSYTQAISLPSAGVNTTKLSLMEHFVARFSATGDMLTIGDIHTQLDEIQQTKGQYNSIQVGLAAGAACSAFVFLLGGGLVEMLGSFIGAGFGNWARSNLIKRHYTLFANLSVGVMVASIMYFLSFFIMHGLLHVASGHEAGYIGALLFVIPGFPFITSGLDLAKTDMRSGLERLAHALLIILVATLVGWLMAMIFSFKPGDLITPTMSPIARCLLRIVASFVGVFGFSIMFNSMPKMAATAGVIGGIANTLRLELVDWTHIPAGAAAFIGALVAGLLAAAVHQKIGYPRISITVPSIVIMVPGLYMYRAVYNIGIGNLSVGGTWLVAASLIVMFLPLGLITARILTDKKWRSSI